jgi:WXXGXW repeat (2 copies)
MRRIAVYWLFFAFIVLGFAGASFAQVSVAIAIAPPPLPVYEQPVCPGDGYIWTPGYWAWDPDAADYYWVPGTWVLAPEVGFLWTPPWWGWADGGYIFHAGFWGPTVGFYGGIDYGFGYFGHGFVGGRWEGGHFFYNREVLNVNVNVVHNVYNERVTNIGVVNHISFNGGRGGVEARATGAEEAAGRERHVDAVPAQNEHVQAARENRALRASENHGRPPLAATERPGQFRGGGAVAAREAGGTYNPPNRGAENRAATENRGAENRAPENRPAENNAARRPAVHPRDLPPAERAAPPNTGNAQRDQKYQQQQQKLEQKQEQERQKLQARQDREHAQAQQQHANEARNQQMEQRHQQQTQQMAQRHAQQQQNLQRRQAPAPQSKPAEPKR